MVKNVLDYVSNEEPKIGINFCKNCGKRYRVLKGKISAHYYVLHTKDKKNNELHPKFLMLCNECKESSDAGIFVTEDELLGIYKMHKSQFYRNNPDALYYNNPEVYGESYLMSDVRLALMKKHRLKTEDGLNKLMGKLENNAKEHKSNSDQKLKLCDAFRKDLGLSENIMCIFYKDIKNDKITIDNIKEFIEEFKWLNQNGPFFKIYILLYQYIYHRYEIANKILFDSQMFVITDFIDKNGDKSVADIPHSLYKKYEEIINQYINNRIAPDYYYFNP